MKRLALFLASLLWLAGAFGAHAAIAAKLGYSPSQVELTVHAGGSAAIPVSIGIEDFTGRTFFVWTRDRVEGDIPLSWVSASPATGFAMARTPLASTLRLAVPADAPAGTYFARVLAKAMASHGLADPGAGLQLVLHVPSRCQALPVIEIEAFGPGVIWPPNHRLEAVTVRGRVATPEGCSLLDAGFVIEDEYGTFSSTGSLVVDAVGAFVVSLPVQASRDGRDKDGRHYRIRFFAQDEFGLVESEVLEAIVPHDLR